MRRLAQRRREFGFVLVLIGVAAAAFGWLGFSIVALVMIIIGAVAALAGLIMLRPTGRTLAWLLVSIAFVTMPVWLIFLVGAIVS